MASQERAKFGPLSGLRIMDFTHALAAPFATQVLADMGAEVVKIEAPRGDWTRRSQPFHPSDVERQHSGYFNSINRNKQSIVIDLKTDEGQKLARRLVGGFDVVVENFRAGVMDRLGLSYETLSAEKPDLVYAALRGFGDPRSGDSPYVDWPAYDVVAQAMGGMMGVTGSAGGEPTKVGPGIGDTIPGLYLAIGLLSAVLHARRTGEGQFVDVAMVDCILGVSERIVNQYYFGGVVPKPEGSHHPFVVPFGVFPASDGHITLACPADRFFATFCELTQAPDLLSDARFATARARSDNRDAAIEAIGRVTARFTKNELMTLLGGRVPFGPVYNVAEISTDPHFAARGMLQDVAMPGVDHPVKVVGVPIKLSRTPGQVATPGPELGSDTRTVLERAGLTSAEIAKLFAGGVVSDRARSTSEESVVVELSA
jgi:crotonobetainyl-CoA:carnitine CoA-transferase CaiB-like acyl-CoA transferase